MIYNGWETFGKALGNGAQGTVYKARNPARVEERKRLLEKIAHRLRQINGMGTPSEEVSALATEILDLGSPDPLESLGALKIFTFPEVDSPEFEKTRSRLQSEIRALQQLKHSAILKFLDGSHMDYYVEQFIVTEYFPDGTLHENLKRFKGHALEALLVFRPLVEAVVAIHQQNAIHRDIKPKNIFVAADGRLVLGDFGIVLFKDIDGRVTETYDRPGSRDWMAPWVNIEHRFELEEMNPTLDIFPLGKVLWCMVSGRHQLPYWDWDRSAEGSIPAYNLEHLFPDDPTMPVINSLLAKCVVREKANCIKTAAELLAQVDKAITQIRGLGLKSEDAAPWLCMVCKKGYYRKEQSLVWRGEFFVASTGGNATTMTEVYFCDRCGHMEAFRQRR